MPADAAVAAGFVLQVVEPHLNGVRLGGLGPHDPGEQQTRIRRSRSLLWGSTIYGCADGRPAQPRLERRTSSFDVGHLVSAASSGEPRRSHSPTSQLLRNGHSARSCGWSREPTISPTKGIRGDICHVDVVDANGMMILATPSKGWMESSPTILQLGFCLSHRGQMFWTEGGLPNSLGPGARPRTTLSPSVALRDGKPWLAFGTPGGDAQDQWQVRFFLNPVHGRLNLEEAIGAPRLPLDARAEFILPT